MKKEKGVVASWAAIPYIFIIFITFLLRSTHVAILLTLTWRLTKSVQIFNKI